MVVTVSLWIDQLINNDIGDFATFLTLYKVTSFITLVLLIPWLMIGWSAARRELHLPMLIFLFLSTLYLAGWGVMFFSTTFRWTFTTWSFFAVIASTSVFLTLMATVLGIVCRCNFGKGLAHYLNTNQPNEENRMSADIEKIPFFAPEKPPPVFSFVRKGSDSIRDLGSNYAFDTTVDLATFLQSTLQRNTDNAETRHTPQRSTSSGSNGSSGQSSYHSRSNSDRSSHGRRQRWIIE